MLSPPRVIVLPERLGKLKRFNDLIWNRTRDLPAGSIVPLPTTIPRAPVFQDIYWECRIGIQICSSLCGPMMAVCSLLLSVARVQADRLHYGFKYFIRQLKQDNDLCQRS
jgi:hypothetical protein